MQNYPLYSHSERTSPLSLNHPVSVDFSYLSAKMIYGYIRVSTDKQTVENQRFEIKRFCKENNLMSVLNRCMEIGAKVWTIKDNYRLGDDITSKVLAFAFGISAEIERKLISQRTKEALARKKSEGVKLGRPKGPGKRILDGKEKQIKAMLAAGLTKVQMSKVYGIHVSTLHEFLTVKELR